MVLLYFLFYSDISVLLVTLILHSPCPFPFCFNSPVLHRVPPFYYSFGCFHCRFLDLLPASACVCDVLWFLADCYARVLTPCQPQHPVSLVTLCRRKRLVGSAALCQRLHLGPTAQVLHTFNGAGRQRVVSLVIRLDRYVRLCCLNDSDVQYRRSFCQLKVHACFKIIS